uniref:Imidazoleglycerol-phosphate dehydratase n=1 Tax=Candidatus Methanosuratincola petrocarbonis (ex Vanwonterghem et al. 2016) TaxID=1867261 RepID=A0A7J3V1A7_9CREN
MIPGMESGSGNGDCARAREGCCDRKTQEVKISARVCLEGPGEFTGSTGSAFIDHMIRTLAKHASIRIDLEASGDLKHHIIEDTALVLGEAIRSALGEKKGIKRFGHAYVPMDDSLARSVIDLGGRAYSRIKLNTRGESIEDTKVEDIVHFLESFAASLKCNLHMKVLYGSNDHHKVEAAVKALAVALREAVSLTGREDVPSAKGAI